MTRRVALGILVLGILVSGGRSAEQGEADVVAALGLDLETAVPDGARERIEAIASAGARAGETAEIVVDYPLPETVFPPDFVAPRSLWHDASAEADQWLVDVALPGGERIRVLTAGPPLPPGEIDPRALGDTNEAYEPTPYQASARSFEPGPEVWEAIKERSVEKDVTVTIVGVRAAEPTRVLSRGSVVIRTSKDPVGAPIFYRDVPLMPSKTEKNVIKPLSEQALPLIAWRLRDVARPKSRVVLHDMPTCANCHSFSADGTRLGMDIDGPDGDKGAYTIAPIRPETKITRDTLISWNSYPDKPRNHRTIGFLSRISPDGQYVVTTLNEELYVSNFTNYRFLQVFYPTRGILAYYSSRTDEIRPLPGADDADYVHCDPVWSPDGSYLVFARARARDSYEKGTPIAAFPNDPNETPMKYDLYRMPFNGGRGGVPVPIEGASANGMSNSFPKVSPDGRFVVFVKAKNGQLLRPDSELWIVPAEGGEARRMECNTALMNSWHSFNPTGRWMVFSSKVNRPYTQMFLTHVDEEGRSTPPVLVPDSTADNRAVNIPEFVNVDYDQFVSIEAPSVEHYRHFNRAMEMLQEDQVEGAITELAQALEIEPDSVKSHLLMGTALWRAGRVDEAMSHYEAAVGLDPARAQAQYSLSFALFLQDRYDEAIARFKTAFEIAPRWGELPDEYDAGLALPMPAPPKVVVEASHRRLAREPGDVSALLYLASVRAAGRDDALRDGEEAVQMAKRACTVTRFQIPEPVDVLAGAYAEAGRFDEAVTLGEFAVWFARAAERTELVPGAERRLALYREGRPYRREN